MTLAYPLRLVGLCLAVFFLVHTALGAVASLAAPLAVRAAARMRAVESARFLLAVRFLAPVGAIFAVAALCVPSYLWLEPERGGERVGFIFVAAALCAASMWAISIARAARAAARSASYGRACRRAATERRVTNDGTPAWVVDAPAPPVALAGIVRPRVFVARRLAEALTADELSAAVLHERAHQDSRDNLKRLCLLLSPGLLPFHRGFDALERAWARFAEWAADDSASAGDARAKLSLAAALVRSARMAPPPPAPELVTSLLGGYPDLAARVERLLRPTTPGEYCDRVSALFGAAGCVMVALSLIVVAHPGTYAWVHHLMEHLVS